MIERVRHAVNGKLLGFLFKFSSGENLYLSLKSNASRALDVKTNSWCLEIEVLRYAQRMLCAYVGIAHKVGTNKYDYYIAAIGDFLGEPGERHPGPVPMRRLNRYKFPIRVSKYGKRRIVAMEEARLSV